MNSTYKAAMGYIQRGWSVVPIPHGEKGPRLIEWQKLRITAGEAAEYYFATESNIGLVLGVASGGMVCIDLDHDVAVELAERFLPPTGLVAGRTQRPGTHWFYIVNGELKTKSFKLPDTGGKPTVEILSDGRQAVVGPSVHPTGDVYDVLGDGEAATVDAEDLFVAVAMLHAAVLDRLKLQESPPTETRADRQPSGTPTNLRPGDDFNERGDIRELLRRHGWQFVHGGANEHWRRPGKDFGTSATLKDGKLFYVFSSSAAPFEPSQCYSPFGVFTILEHGGNFSAATVALRSAGYGDSVYNLDLLGLAAQVVSAEDADDQVLPPIQVGLPSDLLYPPGFLGEFVRYCDATAHRLQPELALATGVTLLSTLCGRKFRDRLDTRCNIFWISLAGSGAGKERPRQVIKLLLATIGRAKLFCESFASAPAVVTFIDEVRDGLALIDEFGRYLKASTSKKAESYLSQVPTVMMKLYTSSNTTYVGDRYANTKQNETKIIHNPNLNVMATTVPENFFGALSSENVTDGLLNRFLVIQVVDDLPKLRESPSLPLPEQMVEEARYWAELKAGNGDLAELNPEAIVIDETEEATTLFRTFSEHCDNIARNPRTRASRSLWVRTLEKSRKLAMVYALSESRSPKIGREATEWGIRLATHCTEFVEQAAGEWIADTPHQANVKQVLRLIDKSGPAGITRTKLYRAMDHALKSSDLDAIVIELIAAGKIFLTKIPTDGRFKELLTSMQFAN